MDSTRPLPTPTGPKPLSCCSPVPPSSCSSSQDPAQLPSPGWAPSPLAVPYPGDAKRDWREGQCVEGLLQEQAGQRQVASETRPGDEGVSLHLASEVSFPCQGPQANPLFPHYWAPSSSAPWLSAQLPTLPSPSKKSGFRPQRRAGPGERQGGVRKGCSGSRGYVGRDQRPAGLTWFLGLHAPTEAWRRFGKR